jgi:hypothetical protein
VRESGNRRENNILFLFFFKIKEKKKNLFGGKEQEKNIEIGSNPFGESTVPVRSHGCQLLGPVLRLLLSWGS